MNKRELTEEMVFRTGATKEEVQQILDVFAEVVTDTLKTGGEVWLPGFGRFYIRERKSREDKEMSGTDPVAGEVTYVPTGKIPAFRPGKDLMESVRRSQ